MDKQKPSNPPDPSSSRFPITEYVQLLEPAGLAAITCLAQAVWLWSRHNVSDPQRRGEKARSYLDRLALVDFSRPQRRAVEYNGSYNIAPKAQIVQKIVTFAIGLPFEESADFLVELTAQWAKTYNGRSIRDSAVANHYLQLEDDASDELLSRYLLHLIFNELADYSATDSE
jgi:hypothetical protein